MDTHDPQVKAELAQRLNAISTDEAMDPAHQPLTGLDLGIFAITCAALVALGLGVMAL